jgi:hypothetical protein
MIVFVWQTYGLQLGINLVTDSHGGHLVISLTDIESFQEKRRYQASHLCLTDMWPTTGTWIADSHGGHLALSLTDIESFQEKWRYEASHLVWQTCGLQLGITLVADSHGGHLVLSLTDVESFQEKIPSKSYLQVFFCQNCLTLGPHVYRVVNVV